MERQPNDFEPLELGEDQEIFDLITRTHLGQHDITEPLTSRQENAHQMVYGFGRLMEAELQLSAIKTMLNSKEEGVDPEQVKAVSEVQTILNGAAFGAFAEIRGSRNMAALQSAQTWVAHLRELQEGRSTIVLFPQRNPIDVPGMLNSFLMEDAQSYYRK